MQPSARGIFVTGTDTGIGKTHVAVGLLRSLAALGVRAIGMKPVATGFTPDAGVNEDVAALARASGSEAPVALTNPYAFAPPIAPHLAAALAGQAIEIERVAAAYAQLARSSEAVVVEGAGGVLVPLERGCDMLDIAVRLQLPVLLVVGMRLGCLNHALLSALALRARGVRWAGWVANVVEPGMAALDENVATLQGRLAAPMIARIAYGADAWFSASICADIGLTAAADGIAGQ